MATAVDFWNEVDRRIDARISGISGMAGTESADGTSAPPPAAGGLPIHNNAHHEPPLALQSDLESLTFLDLLDTPATYAGSPLFLLRVNAGATAVEFADGSLLYDSAGAADAAVAAHVAALDPHTQYYNETRGDARYALIEHLQAVANGGTGLTGIAADNLIYSSAINTFSPTPITAFGRDFIDSANAAAARTTLELNAGEAGDIWVEKAGDTMTGTLTVDLGDATHKGLVIQGAASQTANLLELQSSAAAGVAAIDGEGRMALGSSTTTTDTYLRIIQTFTVTSGDQFGVNAALFSNPAGASTARYFGFQGTARTGTAASAKNNENHTGTFHGVSANVVHNGDGTMSTAIGALLAISIRSGADGTITNAYGAQISTPSLGGGTSAITNYAGIAMAAVSAPGNETYLLLGTTTIPSGSYAIHSTTTFDSYLAGNLGLGTSSPAVALHVADATALTNTVQELLRLDHNTSGMAAAGFGTRALFRLESSTTADQDAAAIQTVWGVATHASRTSYVSILTVTNAGALAEVARFDKGGTATPPAASTGLMIWDTDNATLERVTVGAADSGGTGFKVLRIPN